MKTDFGILTPQMSLTYEQIRNIWMEAETCGFDSASLVDDFFPYDYPDRPITDAFLECWVTLSALARDTKTIRLGSLISCNSFRSPALLAKMAATLDVISNGRLNFGIGAGSLRLEHEPYGFQFPKFSIRTEMLAEAIQLIKLMWTEEKATFEGKYYQLREAVNTPKPIQQPNPPIWVGAEQEKMIRFAARYADVWNFTADLNPHALADYEERIRIFENECDLIGRNPRSIRKSWLGVALLDQSKESIHTKIVKLKTKSATRGITEGIIGTAEECTQRIGEFLDLGISEFIIVMPEILHTKCLQEFHDKVIAKI
ncbi:MAG TPA: LLM class flavin-dependent oxidoreductase [Candidatus Acidoferrum sp.]|nr:LLM class flavin-dependent oxidoreductase [Candidatus Acidoferrum sp.]